MKTTFSLPDDTSIQYVRTFNAPIDRVWAAYTEPEVVRNWLLGPSPETTFDVCEMDMRTGGKFRWVWNDPEGQLEIFGEVLEAVPPHKLVTTEQVGGTDWPPTHNVVEFASDSNGLTVMTGLITYASKEARDGAYASGMGDGMDVSFEKLEAQL